MRALEKQRELTSGLDVLPLPAVELNADSHVVTWNRAAEDIFGWSSKEAVGKPLPVASEQSRLALNILCSTEISSYESNIGVDIRLKEGGSVTTRVWLAAGHHSAVSPKWCLVFWPLADAGSTAVSQSLPGLLAAAIESMPQAIFAKFYGNGEFILWNRECELLFGRKAQEVIGRTDFDILAAEQAAFSRSCDLDILNRNRQVTIKRDVVDTPDRGPRILTTSKIPVCDTRGTPRFILGVAQDITDELAEKEQLLRLAAAVEQVSESILITDTTGTVLYVNPAFSRITGYQASEIIGNKPSLLKSGKHNETFYRHLWETILAGKVWSGIILNRVKDGRLIEHETAISPVRDSEGQIKYFVAIKRGLSETKMAEAQMRQQQKLEAVGSLAAGIAHEINTPTQFVGDNLRFLADAFQQMGETIHIISKLKSTPESEDINAEAIVRKVRDSVKEMDIEYLSREIPLAIEEAVQGVGRVATIVRAMKDFSHPDKGEKVLIDINEALRTTLTVARNELKYVADIVTEFDGSLPAVPAFAGELNQVFLNLFVNAAHAIADVVGKEETQRGTIRVSTRKDGKFALIAVSDTGSGIRPEIADRIFEPFFTTKEVGKGTGQGLAIARSVIEEKHQGSLMFESEVGMGTTFYVRLPFEETEDGTK